MAPSRQDLRLDGAWRVAPLTAELNRTGVDPQLDDSAWSTLSVPGHWAQSPEFADHTGPMLYRRRFEHRQPEASERLWLRLDGVLSAAEVWLDGDYLGDTVGYFSPDRFEITAQANARAEHLVAIDVACPPGGPERDKASLTGALQTGPLAPAVNPGGIWRGVSIEATGPVAIRYSRLLCTEASANRARLTIRLVLDAAEATEIQVETLISGPTSDLEPVQETRQLAAGENRIEWTVDIEDPERWWPATIRPEQPLYSVEVTLRPITADDESGGESEGEAGPISDQVSWQTGLRTVSMKDLMCRVNGERLYCKSIAYGPTGDFLGQVDPSRIRDDVAAIKAAGIDLIRVYGHVARNELYAEADRQGLLIWQDMPLIGGYTSKVRGRILTIARSLVDHVGHHPSVAVLGAHCEPNESAAPVLDEPLDLFRRPAYGAQLVRHVLPSWNRSLLTPLIARELRNADRTRTVVASSGSLPTAETSDAHLWLGWRAGKPGDLATLLRRWPRLAAFTGGIGAQSAAVGPPPTSPATWERAEMGSISRYLPPVAYRDLEQWVVASWAYQAELLRTQIETLRRLKYRPSGGFCLTAFADPEPGGGFGIVDAQRRAKPAFDAVVDACRPVIVVAEPPEPVVVPGEELRLPVHVINDLRNRIKPVAVTAKVSFDGDAEPWHTQRWQGELAADDCARIGDLTFTVPDQTGQLTIDLELDSAAIAVTNRYQTVIIPEAEA